ncbi:MAG TPA: hypothetical protein VK912_19435 [Longimicrobiales bacterium]|nr:hypothetical protein [Longimicrobiales bacterium]
MSTLRSLFTAGVAATLLAGCSEAPSPTEPAEATAAQQNLRMEVGGPFTGPPFYSLIQPGWFPMTDDWAVVAWIRETDCVPDDFNILALVDLTIAFPPAVPFPAPRPIFCPLTIAGHEIWNTDPPDPSVGPLNITAHGKGAVPIWFVSTTEVAVAMSDGVLTISELSAMSSLLVGHAHSFTLTQQTGVARGRPGEGKINIVAQGTLEDGRTFFFQTAEGPPKKPEIAHTRVEFR